MSEHLLDPIRSVRSIDPRPAKAGKIVINSQIADIGGVATLRIKFYSYLQFFSDICQFNIWGLRHCLVLDKYQCPLILWPWQRQTMRSPNEGVEGYGLLTTAYTYSMRSWVFFL